MSDRLTGTYTPGAGDPSITAVQTDANGNLIVTGGGAGALDIDLKEVNGSTTTSGAGAVAAGTLRATLASDDPAVTALQVIDDWDESDRAKVNIKLNSGVAVDIGTGAASTGTARVVSASDSPDVTALQIMDDWDESDRAKVNINLNSGVAVDIGSGNASTGTARVMLASDDKAVTALEKIDDWDESDRCAVNVKLNSGVAVDIGTGAASTGTARIVSASDSPDVTALQIMDDWDESDRCKVNVALNSGVAVDIGSGTISTGTQRVTLATDGVVGACQNTDDSAIGTKGLSITAKGKTSQRAAVSDGDAVQPIANEYGELVVSGHTFATRSIRVEEINSLSSKYLGNIEASAAGGAANTYSYYIDMAGYSKLGLQFTITPVSGVSTLTIHGSMQDDLTAPASCTYQDITNAIFGVASYKATGMALGAAGNLGLFKYIKVQVISTGNDTWTIYSKKMY